MPVCTFFGHRDCPDSIRPKLCDALIDLIENHAVDVFYVGRQGAFDAMVCAVLKELADVYPWIRYAVVLERMSQKREAFEPYKYTYTVFPEELAAVHPRFAIARRNEWMLKHADVVVAYVICGCGGAAKYAQFAKRQNKTVINLAEQPQTSI